MTAPERESPVNGGIIVEGERRLLIKKGGWLRRPVRRWCAIERDELVYFSSKDARCPKGRIPLRECAVGEVSPNVEQPLQGLHLIRAGKGPCKIHFESAVEFADIAAYIQASNSSSSSSSGPVPAPIVPVAASSAALQFPDEDGFASASSSSMPPQMQDSQLRGTQVREFDAPLTSVCPSSPRRSGQDCSPSSDERRSDREDAAGSPESMDFIFGRVVGAPRDGNPSLSSMDFSPEDMLPAEDGQVHSSHATQAPPPSQPLQPLMGDLSDASQQEWVARSGCEEWVVPSIAMESPMPRRPEDSATAAAATPSAAHRKIGGVGMVTQARKFEANSRGNRRVSAMEAYREAMSLMWNYKLDQAKSVLEPYRTTVVWHSCAYAECSTLRVVLTGRRCDALSSLELVREAEQLKDTRISTKGSSLALDVCTAELLLMRCGLQVVTGSRLTLFFGLRRCWYAYRRLEHILFENGQGCASGVGSCTACPTDLQHDFKVVDREAGGDALSLDDIKGRVCFGLGLFYLVTSMLPVGLCPLIRLAGFLIDRQQGKAYLARCVDGDLGPRASLATILLSMYHLDLEPDMERAGNLLIHGLSQKPQNVLLHWATSLLAWRNADIESAVTEIGSALLSAGDDLRDNAIYLRYELGMFQFMAMYWPMAHEHLRFVHDAVQSDKIFFPYRTLVSAQLAAVCFSMGRDAEGEALCRESSSVQQEWSGGALRLEGDFVKVMQLFLKRRVVTRKFMAFEVMYLLRQLPRVPGSMLQSLQDEIRREAKPYEAQFVQIAQRHGTSRQCGFLVPQIAANSPEMGIVVEHVSAQVMQCIILFYLGDVEQAMSFVPHLSYVCTVLPPWCDYLKVHGLYWCGRVFALSNQNSEALRCLREAKVHKKYPFNISTKVSKVLETLEQSQ